MDLLSFIFLFLGFASLGFSISIFIISVESPLAIIFLVLFGVLSFLAIILFSMSNKMMIRRFSQSHFSLSKKISNHCKSGHKTIIFIKSNKKWRCDMFGDEVVFDLSGYAFKRVFLTAFVVRALRYPHVSKQKPIRFIWKKSLKGIKKDRVVDVAFNSGKKTIIRKLLADGVSKSNLYVSAINEFLFAPTFSYKNYNAIKYENVVTKLDEESYCHDSKYFL